MSATYSKLIAQDKTHAQWLADPAILSKGQLIFTVDGYVRQGDGATSYANSRQLFPVDLPDTAVIPKGVVTFAADATAAIVYKAGIVASIEYVAEGKWHVTFTTQRATQSYPVAFGFIPPDSASYDRQPIYTNTSDLGFEIHTRDITSDGYYNGGTITAIIY